MVKKMQPIPGMQRPVPGGADVKTDPVRVRRYLTLIRKNSLELNNLIDNNHLTPGSLELKAAKYLLIEIAEAMSNTIQHILAKDRGLAVSGYIDAILKAYDSGLINEDLFKRLKPFSISETALPTDTGPLTTPA